ncbi:HTH-type transcriptional regulator CdhR [Vibrio ruber DSM 16370]|uniref:HTH-type transcriptional regulator CdhR n=1 Tax=Vibrio ruber (strain DSM 16370 / JCM 11486 / BCRC 17186 / CECT 7878 / LMG 23124 / VR1) TaxID=1123498 RepID=A0A1R4LFZ6_VIBR1|nr:helix-turn-helix domain-containing protein [Vibrio ruber]SJN55455.1 HTH-type transcriptional regulator CdhR [Vibrio ruber DSM 16370]
MANPYQIYFLINSQIHLLDLAGPVQAINNANQLTDQFETHFIGFSDHMDSHQGLGLAHIATPPEQLPDRAVIFVCGSKYSQDIYTDTIAQQSIDWLKQAIQPDTYVVGVCTGTFLLAKAGLTQGKDVTTHHDLVQVLANQFPGTQVLADRIFVHYDNLITSAGVTAGIDTTLYLIERLTSVKTAVDVARELVVHRRRMAHDPQISVHFKHRNHISPLIHAVQDYILDNYQHPLTISDLCQHFRVSPRHLQRTFKAHTEATLRDYIAETRLQEAKVLIDNGMGVEQAAYLSGFPNPAALRTVWKKRFASLPSQLSSHLSSTVRSDSSRDNRLAAKAAPTHSKTNSKIR